jgi:4-hydroxybenzoate polyprenyltransferase
MFKKILPIIRLMRLHQPAGYFLLFWPCSWGILFGADSSTAWVFLLGLFFVGSVVMRSAGCVINDIMDIDIDKKVERTRNRPLASGALSKIDAYWVLVSLLVVGAVILWQLNVTTIVLGFGFLAMVVLYPLAKRFVAVPQIILGLTFNAGALMGYSAATDTLTTASFLLYLGAIFWTVGYDTIYAHQDIKDDLRTGVRSSAIAFRKAPKAYIAGCYLIATVLWLYAASEASGSLPIYIALILATLHMAWQVVRVDLNNPKSCAHTFKSNVLTGALLFLGLFVEMLQSTF